VAALLGGRNLFFVDAASFLLSGLLILTLPVLRAEQGEVERSTWTDIKDGTARLWRDPPIRFALLLELVAAVTGALILVNTVSRIQGDLKLSEATYGWVMAAYGLGATLASLAVGLIGKRWPRTRFILLGALVTSAAVLPGNVAPLPAILALWLLAGIGQNWVNLPAETLPGRGAPRRRPGPGVRGALRLEPLVVRLRLSAGRCSGHPVAAPELPDRWRSRAGVARDHCCAAAAPN